MGLINCTLRIVRNGPRLVRCEILDPDRNVIGNLPLTDYKLQERVDDIYGDNEVVITLRGERLEVIND